MLPPPRRGAPPRSAWTIQAELPHWEKQGGSGCFPPHARPSSQPGRSPRPAGNPRGPKRSAEAALHELFTFKPPSPIFGAQPPHSPTLWGRFGPLSSLSFPPGAGGRTEPQRPPGRAAGAWCRPAQVRSPSSRPRRPRLRAQGDTKPPPPSWPSPPRHAARAGALVPRSAAITSARAAPRLRVEGHPEQEAPGSRTLLTAGQTDSTQGLPRQSAPEPRREPGTFAK